jgi:Protein NO VEIN, C-terminal
MKLVDAIAMELAVAHLENRHSGVVRRMPHNNPGYDILVSAEGAALRHVEVKGTTRPKPHFFMSEGERLFSEAHDDSYTLLVVYDIDVQSRTGVILERPGPVGGDGVELWPITWEARFS